jgi:acyl-CoA synthetase (AMP-forming)/AMP-acid ligase II
MRINIGQILANRAFLTPNLEACVGTGYRFTFKEVNARANRWAAWLARNGLKQGDRIAVLAKNNEHATCALYGAAKSGVITVLLNWRLTGSELSYILNDSGASLLIYDADFASMVDQIRPLISATRFIRKGGQGTDPEFEAVLAESSDSEPNYVGGGNDACVIMYTSGTTGKPKGAMLSHDNTHWASLGLTHTLQWAHKDRYLLVAPLFHIGGLAPYFANVHVGATTVFMPDFDPAKVFQIMAEERINFLMTVPLMLQAMAMVPEAARPQLPHFRHFICGASPVPASLIRLYDQWGLKICQVYGATEYAGASTFWTHDMGLDKVTTAGRPVFHGDVKVFAPGASQELPRGEVGELCLFGPQVFLGYWNNPSATKQVLADGCYRSGDLGKMDESGCVTVVDRLKDMIISGGENIYPAEIENVIKAHPAVAEVAVAGKPSQKWGEIPVGFIVTKPNASVTEEEIIALCRKDLAGFKCVKEVRFVQSIPKNATGKILKHRLRAQLAE